MKPYQDSHSVKHLFKSKAALPTRAKHAATLCFVHEYTLDMIAFICPPQRSNQSILKEIKPEYSLEGVAEAEAEAPLLWPPEVKS